MKKNLTNHLREGRNKTPIAAALKMAIAVGGQKKTVQFRHPSRRGNLAGLPRRPDVLAGLLSLRIFIFSAHIFLQKIQGVFLGLFRFLTRCFGRFLECLIRDVLWIAHIIIRHFTSAVITHKYSLPFYLGIFSSGLIQPLRDLICVIYSTFFWVGSRP